MPIDRGHVHIAAHTIHTCTACMHAWCVAAHTAPHAAIRHTWMPTSVSTRDEGHPSGLLDALLRRRDRRREHYAKAPVSRPKGLPLPSRSKTRRMVVTSPPASGCISTSIASWAHRTTRPNAGSVSSLSVRVPSGAFSPKHPAPTMDETHAPSRPVRPPPPSRRSSLPASSAHRRSCHAEMLLPRSSPAAASKRSARRVRVA
eukprot:scaffold496_cov119-Isochrysis_galbana.AAC.9